jgi:hypothetical protein
MRSQNAKAVVSALVSGIIAFLSSLLTAVQGQQTGIDTITLGQWLTSLLAFFVGLGVAGGATYRTPNVPRAGVPQSSASLLGQ